MKRETLRRLERLEGPKVYEFPPAVLWLDSQPKPEGWDTAERKIKICLIEPRPHPELEP
jgi:hypothetical protein